MPPGCPPPNEMLNATCGLASEQRMLRVAARALARRSAAHPSTTRSADMALVYPVYLDVPMMTAFLASLEGGVVEEASVSHTASDSEERSTKASMIAAGDSLARRPGTPDPCVVRRLVRSA